jgi:SAM-dependent methyltransferase
MKWFAERGYAPLGIDRSAEALAMASFFGETVHADIEGGPWPLQSGESVRQFDAVVVTNYLWRPLFPVILQSLAPGGILIYETFAQGNGAFGKPSNPDFLLAPGELLSIARAMRIIAFEEGFLDNPPRFVQRIAAAQGPASEGLSSMPHLYPL